MNPLKIIVIQNFIVHYKATVVFLQKPKCFLFLFLPTITPLRPQECFLTNLYGHHLAHSLAMSCGTSQQDVKASVFTVRSQEQKLAPHTDTEGGMV